MQVLLSTFMVEFLTVHVADLTSPDALKVTKGNRRRRERY